MGGPGDRTHYPGVTSAMLYKVSFDILIAVLMLTYFIDFNVRGKCQNHCDRSDTTLKKTCLQMTSMLLIFPNTQEVLFGV
jgi:hypothetical protein